MTITRYNAIYSLVGGELSGTEDGSRINYISGQTPPTEAEIDSEVIRLQTEFNSLEYARNRASAYPSTGDQLDYIYHNGVAKWKTDMIDPVKTKYPKG